MPANVETMFSVREVPWHGLGTIVDKAPNSKFAIELAELDWRVEGKSVFDAAGNEIPGYIANTRDSDNSVLGIVTDRYKVVQNSEAFEFTDSLLDEGITYETAGSLRDGKTIWLLAKMPEQKILDDKFDPYICFMNTHDGTGAVKVCMTPIRVVCNNTLNLAINSATRTWATKHVGNIQGKLAEAKHTLGLAHTYMSALDVEADILANTKISDTEFEAMFDGMFPIDYMNDTPRKINNINELKMNLFNCYAQPDIARFHGTGWGIINAATDLVAHTPPARLSANYQANNFGKIVTGHPFVDNLYNRIKQVNNV